MWESISLLLAGVALFLYGIMLLSNRAQQLASGAFRKLVYKYTKNPASGLVVGAGFTTVIQSSGATNIITMTLVNAGIITLSQALGILLGSEIGTTITAQLIAFKLAALAPFFVALGFAIYLTSRGKRKIFGEAVLAFGLLFLGIMLMDMALAPFEKSGLLQQWLASVNDPLSGFVVSLVITSLVQSSSVTTSLAVLLAQKGALGLLPAVGVVLGANIGSCIPVLVASTVVSRNAKRVSLAQLIINASGAIAFLLIAAPFAALVATTASDAGRQVANAHTIYNVATSLFFLAIIAPFERFLKKLFPGEEREVHYGTKYVTALSSKVAAPEVALELARKEIVGVAGLVGQMVDDAEKAARKFDDEHAANIKNSEGVVDEICRETSEYLIGLCKENSLHEEKQRTIIYYNVLHELERTGDHCVVIADLLDEKYTEKIEWPKNTERELLSVVSLAAQNYREAARLIESFDERKAREIMRRHAEVKRRVTQLSSQQLATVLKGESRYSGTVFEDVLFNVQSWSRHAASIAKKLSELANQENARKNENAERERGPHYRAAAYFDRIVKALKD